MMKVPIKNLNFEEVGSVDTEDSDIRDTDNEIVGSLNRDIVQSASGTACARVDLDTANLFVPTRKNERRLICVSPTGEIQRVRVKKKEKIGLAGCMSAKPDIDTRCKIAAASFLLGLYG